MTETPYAYCDWCEADVPENELRTAIQGKDRVKMCDFCYGTSEYLARQSNDAALVMLINRNFNTLARKLRGKENG